MVVDDRPLLLDDDGGEALVVAGFWLIEVPAAATAEVVETETSRVPFVGQCVKPLTDLFVHYVQAHVCVSRWEMVENAEVIFNGGGRPSTVILIDLIGCRTPLTNLRGIQQWS